jgi:hypothetical protein
MRHRLAFFVVGALLLTTVMMLPFVLSDMLSDVRGKDLAVYPVVQAGNVADVRTYLHLTLTDLNDWSRIATFQVSGNQECQGACPWSDRVLLVSARSESRAEGLPPSATITLPAVDKVITKTATLPVRGNPTAYPFDSYHLNLGVIMQRVAGDQAVTTLTPEDAAGHLHVSLQLGTPNMTLDSPKALDPLKYETPGSEYRYVSITQLSLTRPLRMKVLAVMLVLLVSAGASYAVFLRPLNELVLSAGGLILGVWGVRSILLSSNSPPGGSALDIALSCVILFLLGAISWRALDFYDERSGYRVLSALRLKARPPAAEHEDGESESRG